MTIEWDHAHVPMKDSEQVAEEAFYVQDPEAVLDAMSQIKGILDAKYKQADLHKVAASASHLAVEEQSHLHEALTEYSDLFDETLGKWNMGVYDIELCPEATPYHARVFPIPKAYTDTLKVEVFRTASGSRSTQASQPFRMGGSDIYHSKKGRICQIHLQLSRTE
jgi:hypothetical protein